MHRHMRKNVDKCMRKNTYCFREREKNVEVMGERLAINMSQQC